MAKRKSDKKPIEQYDHKSKKRVNNPPVGLVTPETDPDINSRGVSRTPDMPTIHTLIHSFSGLARLNILHLKYPPYPFMFTNALILAQLLRQSVNKMVAYGRTAVRPYSYLYSPPLKKTHR